MNDITKIINFFTGKGLDHKGRSLADYLNFSDEELENIHDYIQWAFPTITQSKFNHSAPLLEEGVGEYLRRDKVITDNFQRMLARMIRFYEVTDHWLVDLDHNHLRITRIIESTTNILGCKEAANFYKFICLQNKKAGSPVNDESIHYWFGALGI